MVAGEILVVLGEELTVLEGYHRTVGSLDECAGVADGCHLASHTVTFDKVAHLDTSRHERYAVVDILDDVLGGKTDTCG